MGITKEMEAMSEVFNIRLQAHPNLIIATHGDALLRRNGAMIKAAERARVSTRHRITTSG
jgi:predicted protein tyrosine phosphatase